MNTKSYKFRGFTLIELMVVVSIIAILLGVALPSYTAHIKRGARAEAKAALLENAQFLERNFTVANTYAKDPAGKNIVLPVGATPRDGGGQKYTIGLDANNSSDTKYQLQAVPVAGSSMEDDECGSFTINSEGVKAVTGTAGVANCWGR